MKNKSIVHLGSIVLLSFMLLSLLPAQSIVNARDLSSFRMIWDDFHNGFTVNTPSAKWIYFSHRNIHGEFVANDGLTTTDNRGLHVVASGVNPMTMEPAFMLTMADENDNAFALPGQLDHYKWVVFMNHTASSGAPGFDAVPGQELSCETWLSGRTFGTSGHPFILYPANPNDDPRLAAVAMTVFDFETRLAFDFWMTNERVYAVYSRLPYTQPLGNSYAAFYYMIPVGSRDPRHSEHLEIKYDKSAGVVRWFLDNREVFQVNQLGFRLARSSMTLDHGGVEQLLSPNQLDCGMGMFTLLDGFRPANLGLVRLSNLSYFYFDPDIGEPTPQLFVDNSSSETSRLFGQGAELLVQRYIVSSRAVR